MKKRTVLYGSLTAALTVCFLLLGFFVFRDSYLRVKEAGADLVLCVKYYLHSVFGETPEEMPSVVEYSDVTEPIALIPPRIVQQTELVCVVINCRREVREGV